MGAQQQYSEYSDRFNKGKPWAFSMIVNDSNWNPLNVTAWQFRIVVKNPAGADLWVAENADILRPTTSSIYYKKDAATVAALPPGEYSFSLYVTNDEAIDDEMVKGIIVMP